MQYDYYSPPTHKIRKVIGMKATEINANNLSYGIIDSGATRSFVTTKAPLTDIRPKLNPVKLAILDRKYTVLTNKGRMNLPHPSKEATEAKIIPDSKGELVIAVKELNDSGCNVLLYPKFCIVIYKNKIVLRGINVPKINLWIISLRYMQYLRQKQHRT